MEDHVTERLAALEANDKNIFHQMNEVKREMKDTRQLTIAVKELAISTKATAEKVDNISDRLDTVEHAPVEDRKYYRRAVIGSILTGVVGTVLGAILTLILK